MTQFAPPEATSPSNATPDGLQPRDSQRETLEQIVKLSIQCSATEQRIDQEHDAAISGARQELQKQLHTADDRAERRTAELTDSTTEQEQSIQARYESRKQEIESENESSESQIVRQRRESESSLKKEYEAATWQADSSLVQFQMKIDTEEQNWGKIEEQSKADLASLDTLETGANRALARCGGVGGGAAVGAGPIETPPLDDATIQRLTADRLGALEEYRNKSATLLNQLKSITQPRATDALIPWFFIILGSGCAAFAGWTFTTDVHSRPLITAGAGAGLFLVGAILWIIFRIRRRAHVRKQAQSFYASFQSTLATAREAARVDSAAAAADRERRVNEAKRKRDLEATAAREKAKNPSRPLPTTATSPNSPTSQTARPISFPKISSSATPPSPNSTNPATPHKPKSTPNNPPPAGKANSLTPKPSNPSKPPTPPNPATSPPSGTTASNALTLSSPPAPASTLPSSTGAAPPGRIGNPPKNSPARSASAR